MSGVQGHLLGHIVRRGVEHFAPGPNPQYVQRLQQDAELYEKSGPELEISAAEMLPILITGLIVILITASIRYTMGEVMASLAMIESPTSTAILEDKPPAYADEPDAPLEMKDGLLPTEAVADVEVMMVNTTPITAKVSTTIKHLHRIGGFRARWRGMGVAVVYHFIHNFAFQFFSHVFAAVFGPSMILQALAYIFVSVMTARLHMVWTHAMIAKPTSVPFWRRLVARKDARSIRMPAFVFAAAQQATILIPLTVATVLRVDQIQAEHFNMAKENHDCSMLVWNILRLLAVPVSGLIVALAVLLPASVTLTRMEALLLPEDQDTIVPFDRQAIIAGVSPNRRCPAAGLFTSAWRSSDRASRWRLIKLYVKMALIQFTVVVIGLHVMLAEMFLIGGERLATFIKSATAQVQLELIEKSQN